MAPKRYNGRRGEIYFPSEKFLKEWRNEAKKARLPLSSWIFATVEANRAALGDQGKSTLIKIFRLFAKRTGGSGGSWRA
jgi:hypothetical protein